MRMSQAGYIKLPFLIGLILFAVIGCAGDKVRDATTWLAAASNEVKDKGIAFKDQRDALATARQMGIQSLERAASALEAQTAEVVLLWTIADAPGGPNPQKALLEKISGQIAEAEKRQKTWQGMLSEENKKLLLAKSSIVPVTDKLAQTIKLLAQLGEDKGFGEQVQFYTTFFSQVGSTLKALEDESTKTKAVGLSAIESKASGSKVHPTIDEEK
jgi:hypothetical protein